MTATPPFQRLLDDHGRAVHRYLVAMVGPDEADDCFQETMLAALRTYGTEVRRPHPWLIQIAHRKALDALRGRARRPVPVATPPEGQVLDAPGLELDPVWRRVAALPDKQRAAVFLRSAADLSYAEVAGALECSEDAARRNVHEGLSRLREELTTA